MTSKKHPPQAPGVGDPAPLPSGQTAADLDAMLAAAKPGSPVARISEAAQPLAEPTGPQRCGLIAIVGKPNVGKSTLMNALVGQKISITSRKAQTTRHRITGIRTLANTQFVFVDTPGFQTRHSTALNKSLNKTVMGAIGDVDLILFVVEAGSFTLADARHSHVVDRQQAGHHPSPARNRTVAARHAGAPSVCRICAYVGQEQGRH